MEINNITFPHITSKIVDNSQRTATNEATATIGTILNAPFISSRGDDTGTFEFTSWETFKKFYGKPNQKIHGQSIYNIKNWLNSKGTIDGYRITARKDVLEAALPEDITYTEDMSAKYANAVFLVKVNIDDNNKNIKIILDIDSMTNYTMRTQNSNAYDNDDLMFKATTVFEKYMNEYHDTEDILLQGEATPRKFKVFPIFGIECNGSGEYGNNFSFKLSPSIRYDKTFTYRCYELSMYEKTNTGSYNLKDSLLISFYPEAVSPNNTTLYIERVITNYATDYKCVVCEKRYNELIYYLNTAANEYLLTPENQPYFSSIYDLDFIFGMTRGYNNVLYNSTENPMPIPLEIVNNLDETLLNVNELGAMSLRNGSDGAFTTGYPNRDKIIDAMYGAYYEGLYNTDVFDKSLFQYDVILDAGFSVETKLKICNLVNIRKDAIFIADTGHLANALPIKLWREKFDPDLFFVALFSHTFTMYDDDNNCMITVTAPCILANIIPQLDAANNRVGSVFVGANNRINGFIDVNFVPATQNDKQVLSETKVNFLERDKNGYYYADQLTTQKAETALSDLNNVRVLCRLMRAIDNIAKDHQFKYATTTELNTFETKINDKCTEFISRGDVNTATASVTQTQYEREMNSCSVNVHIVFTDLLKNFDITYTVSRA